jgi:ATP-dependent helicase/nuclease subunit B
MAYSIASQVSAIEPLKRQAWVDKIRHKVIEENLDWFSYESVLALLALEWAGTSSYLTDNLFNIDLDQNLDLLVITHGLQNDPLGQSLSTRFANKSINLHWQDFYPQEYPGSPETQKRVFATQDIEAEAQCTVQLIHEHIQSGRKPIALVAQDRLLIRRISYMLEQQEICVKDETGWSLATTRAATGIMALLQATKNTDGDKVLNWLKLSPRFQGSQLDLAEAKLRQWVVDGKYPHHQQVHLLEKVLQALNPDIIHIQKSLRGIKPLSEWIDILREALQKDGQWEGLRQDPAGVQCIETLCLAEKIKTTYNKPIALDSFIHWVDKVLQVSRFIPPIKNSTQEVQVHILPLTHLLGRYFDAICIPGCDIKNLPLVTKPSFLWPSIWQEALSLPDVNTLAKRQQSYWAEALRHDYVDILYRQSEKGELITESPLVTQWQHKNLLPITINKATLHSIPLQKDPVNPPKPTIENLPIQKLSASSYQDLRDCPYRFFVYHLLGLRKAAELDRQLNKRDYGNWLHQVLKHFHETRVKDKSLGKTHSLSSDRILLDRIASDLIDSLGLDRVHFLPYQITWTQIRETYIDWLYEQEEKGWQWITTEKIYQKQCVGLVLKGQPDYIDGMLLDKKNKYPTLRVIDYKTENVDKTRKRLHDTTEELQLAFYTALVGKQVTETAYLNLSPQTGKKVSLHHLPKPQAMAESLLQAIEQEITAIHSGTPLLALGEGQICEYCEARGLCRRDYWK